MLNKNESEKESAKGKEKEKENASGNVPVLECQDQGHALIHQLLQGQGEDQGQGRCPVETDQGKG